MSLVLVTAPTAEPLTLDAVRQQLHITDDENDDLLAALITVVRSHLDGRDGWLGRALMQQTWDLKLDAFCGQLELPLAPLRSVTSINYLDPQGAPHTLDPALYQVTGIDNGWKGSVLPAYGKYWPYTYAVPECVTIRFVCGYAPGTATPPDVADAAANIPAPIKQAMQLMINRLFQLGKQDVFLSEDYVEGVGRQRYIVSDVATNIMNDAADMLLSTYRVWNFA